MYGWRMKLGVLTPANNIVIEPELYRFAPNGVAIYTARMQTSGTHSLEGLVAMERNAKRGVKELAATGVDIIVYACISTSLAKETGWDEKFIGEVEEETGIPTTTAMNSMLEALHKMGLEKVAVGTPFPSDINEQVTPFFADYGVRVVAIKTLNVAKETEIGWIPPDAIYGLGKEVDVDEADGVCLLATDISTLDILENLEDDLGKPVVYTNQAILWKALELGGLEPVAINCGALLS